MQTEKRSKPAILFGGSRSEQIGAARGGAAPSGSEPDLAGEVSTQRRDVLLVMVSEDWKLIQESLQLGGMHVLQVSDCENASRVLAANPNVAAVLTDAVLPDGNWCTVLGNALARGATPSVFVCTRHEQQGLWSEVISGGGCYRLVEPHRRKRLGEVISDPLLH